MRKMLAKHGTDTITMNCLGGFAAGKLPAYPCLGFMQLLNDGGQGVCEAMPDDTLSMLMVRIVTGRPGCVSDPARDTSTNQIVYSHCVGTTKVFGPKGTANDYRIRTLHNRDPRCLFRIVHACRLHDDEFSYQFRAQTDGHSPGEGARPIRHGARLSHQTDR